MVRKPGSKHSAPSSRVTARRNDWNSIRVLHQGPRPLAASRGRIHDRSPIRLPKHQKKPCRQGAVHTRPYMIGIRSAFSIRARGHWPHLEAVYMTAPRSVCQNTKKSLADRGPSIHDGGKLEKKMKQPCVYIMANRRDGTVYTGVTANLPRRAFEHRERLPKGFSA